jgi:hypothetical protein
MVTEQKVAIWKGYLCCLCESGRYETMSIFGTGLRKYNSALENMYQLLEEKNCKRQKLNPNPNKTKNKLRSSKTYNYTFSIFFVEHVDLYHKIIKKPFVEEMI